MGALFENQTDQIADTVTEKRGYCHMETCTGLSFIADFELITPNNLKFLPG